MAFNHMGITTAGYELIARATSGDLIDYIGGASSVNTITDVSHTSAPSYYQSLDGVIKSVSSNNYNARIVIEFSNAQLKTAITLKSFAIKAKSVSSSEEVIFAACSVDNGGVTFQPPTETGGIIINFQVPFNIIFDGAASYIEGVEGGSASIGDLERFVSTHSLGDSTTGDAQTIKGEKRFSNEATFYSGCQVYGDVRIMQGVLHATGGANVASLTASNLATFNGMAVFNSGVKLPVTDLDTSATTPVGAIVCLTGLGSNLGVGYRIRGVYSLGSLTGDIDPQGHQTVASQEYTLLTSTTANTRYALAIRIV